MAQSQQRQKARAGAAPKASAHRRDGRRGNVEAIAQRIRAVRARKKITLDELAERVGLDKSYLSRIEHGQKAPSVATLLNIAAALDIQVAQLFGEVTAPEAITVVRRKDRIKMQTGKAGAGGYETVLAPSAHRRMSVFVMDPAERVSRESSVHAGDEMIYVLAGALEVVFSDRSVLLSEGDAVYFEGDLTHEVRARGDVATSALVIVASDLSDARKINIAK